MESGSPSSVLKIREYASQTLIMERDFYRDDFESLLKRKADEYRMYPAEKIWENIGKRLHRNQRAFYSKTIGFTTVLIVFFNIIPSKYQQKFSPVEAWKVAAMTAAQDNSVIVNQNASSTNRKKNFSLASPWVTAVETISENTLPTAIALEEDASAIMVTEDEMVREERNTTDDFVASAEKEIKGTRVSMPDFADITFKEDIKVKNAEIENTSLAPNALQNKTDAELNYEVKVPVINKPTNKELVYHITPSISYRALRTPTSFTFGNFLPIDPDNAVKHSPALGLEFGIAVMTPLTEKIKFISGIQANYTSYEVLAYTSLPQMTSVRLSGFNNIQRVSSLRTNNGMAKQSLLNKTLQVSVPLGLQFRLAGNNNFSWNLSTTVQPSFMLDATGYLVTSDFNNYIKAPEFLRRFNVNGGIETYFTWKSGKTIWQAGPSLRYQVLSNSVSEYPIREHLLQYGFRLGLIRRF